MVKLNKRNSPSLAWHNKWSPHYHPTQSPCPNIYSRIIGEQDKESNRLDWNTKHTHTLLIQEKEEELVAQWGRRGNEKGGRDWQVCTTHPWPIPRLLLSNPNYGLIWAKALDLGPRPGEAAAVAAQIKRKPSSVCASSCNGKSG